MVSKSSAAKRANRARPGPSSMPPLGSMAQTCTVPAAMAGHRPRSSDHSTDPLPAPVTPATRTCEPATRTRQGVPSSTTPTGTASRSTVLGTGRAGTTAARGSWWASSMLMRLGPVTRTRPRPAPRVWAMPSISFSQSAGTWPGSIRTPSRSCQSPISTDSNLGTAGFGPRIPDVALPGGVGLGVRSPAQPVRGGQRRPHPPVPAAAPGPGRRGGDHPAKRPGSDQPPPAQPGAEANRGDDRAGHPQRPPHRGKSDQGAAQAGPTPHEQHRHDDRADQQGGQFGQGLIRLAHLAASSSREQLDQLGLESIGRHVGLEGRRVHRPDVHGPAIWVMPA